MAAIHKAGTLLACAEMKQEMQKLLSQGNIIELLGDSGSEDEFLVSDISKKVNIMMWGQWYWSSYKEMEIGHQLFMGE